MRSAKLVVVLVLAATASAELKQLKPGINLFTPQQDIQMGREASKEVGRQMAIVRNSELDAYLNRILQKLERSEYARTLIRNNERGALFPFSIHAIYDKNINAFALPGGPIYINTGSIVAADNEAQLAGVIAHEMSHVVLRHSTNQVSKRNLVELPALLAGAVTGDSLMGQLAQLGIGLGANSALLKFSRTDETQADYNGTEIMADAGYNPIELARFFEKLEAKGGRGGALEQFLSDHPNPGNRIGAISDEVRQMPQRSYTDDETGEFVHIRQLVKHLPPPPKATEGEGADGSQAPAEPPSMPPSKELAEFDGSSYSLRYPANWQAHRGDQGDAVTIGPRGGVLPDAVGYGIEVNHFDGDSVALVRHLEEQNPEMHMAKEPRNIEVGGRSAVLNTLDSRSPYGGGEVDVVVTVQRPEGLFYMVFIAPKPEFQTVQPVFEDMLRSVRFR
ncbi:MAG TPA: M48 family metallopeptidase [Bryobacteraceae bacterium]|nr:M48 family metallopeptidase [Bryobacteraceae bacterium]